MSEKLLESEFFTVDLRTLFKQANDDTDEDQSTDDTATPENAEAANETGTDEAAEEEEAIKPNTDWSKELERRLKRNSARKNGKRKSDSEIEEKFWKDFFTTVVVKGKKEDRDIVKALVKLNDLKEDIKVLGFNKKTNPILAFFCIGWVQKNLVRAGLITDETYLAIHNAKAGKYVADSEFLSVKKYNILYCRDLYANRTAHDMCAYLKLQKKSLPTNVEYYNEDRKNRNIRIFLVAGQKDVTKSNAKLNKIKEVEKFLGASGVAISSEDSEGSSNKSAKSSLNRADLINIVSSLLKDRSLAGARAQAALQFVSMTTNNNKAKNALKSDRFKNINIDSLMAATVGISGAMSKNPLSEAEADQFVDILLSEFDELT